MNSKFEDYSMYMLDAEICRILKHKGKDIIDSDFVLDKWEDNAENMEFGLIGFVAFSDERYIINKFYEINNIKQSCIFLYPDEFKVNGIVYNYPKGKTIPEKSDIATAFRCMEVFKFSYFYMPVLQILHGKIESIYLYTIKTANDQEKLYVRLYTVIQRSGNPEIPDIKPEWHRSYSKSELAMHY